jgi:hypothetical protein
VPLLKKKDIGSISSTNNATTVPSIGNNYSSNPVPVYQSSSFLPDINGGQSKYVSGFEPSQLVLNGTSVTLAGIGVRGHSRGNSGRAVVSNLGHNSSVDFNSTITGSVMSQYLQLPQQHSGRQQHHQQQQQELSINVSPRASSFMKVPPLVLQQPQQNQQQQQQQQQQLQQLQQLQPYNNAETQNSDFNLSLNLSTITGAGNSTSNTTTKVKKSSRGDKKSKTKPPEPKV